MTTRAFTRCLKTKPNQNKKKKKKKKTTVNIKDIRRCRQILFNPGVRKSPSASHRSRDMKSKPGRLG
jgi:hypothetical protein